MGWFNKQVVSKIAPGLALKREIAQRRLNRLEELTPKNRRSFDAVSANRLRYDFLSPNNSADEALSGADKLRRHVRQMEYNNGFVCGPIIRIVNNVVGLGFQFQSRVTADEEGSRRIPKIRQHDAELFNRDMERAFRKWSKKADKRLNLTFNGLLRQVEGALVRDGEVLVIGRNSTRRDRLIPYCLDVLEIDRLETPMSEINNPKIRNGIRYDREGVPKSYFVLKQHPGETVRSPRSISNDYDETPAFNRNGTRKVIHLFNPLRPEQSRGFSAFASALKDYQDVDRYREAEIMAALEAACLTGIVETPDPTGFQANRTVGNLSEEDGDDTERRIHEFAPGEWHYLNSGEKVQIFHPSRPNDAFGDFTDQLLRGPANALDMPPELLTQDWKGMNYSNARTVLLQFYISCRLRQQFLKDHFCAPVYENVARSLVAMGLVQALSFDRRMDDWLEHAWIPPGWSWVDPIKEAKGKEIEVENNFETLTDVCAARGKDLEETLRTRARELKLKLDLEKEFGVQFPSKKAGAQPAADNGQAARSGGLRAIK